MAVFASFVVLAIVELLVQELVMRLSGLTTEQLLANSILWTALGVTQGLVMILVAVLLSKFRQPAEGLWKE
jgi:hypothetical protein